MSEVLHTCEYFGFVADAPLDDAWPLFGADKERLWAADWEPHFLWPVHPADQRGSVFQIAHGDKTATWVTTCFERTEKNRVQYVYVIPEVVATLITLELTAQGRSTHVAVTYERTALTPAANDTVRNMAVQDSGSGPEWSTQIDAYLRQRA